MAMGEAPIKQAVRWIGEELKHNPDSKILFLVNEACKKFNLSPEESEFLYRKYIYKKDSSDAN